MPKAVNEVVRDIISFDPNISSQELIIKVWVKEIPIGYCFCAKHAGVFGSSPETVLRARRRLRSKKKKRQGSGSPSHSRNKADPRNTSSIS